MLALGQQYTTKPILSLRTGTPVGSTLSPIINPNNLKIEGWHAEDRFDKRHGILLSQDIRDVLVQGFVVNDHDAITNPHELIRLEKILQINFQLVGKPVITNHKKRVGKVSDYAFDKDSFMIQKLYVAESVFKNFSGGTRLIDRTQIVEITDRKIVVREATSTDSAPMPAAMPAN